MKASTELAGGGYSPFLEPERRRELAKIICEALLLSFPKYKGFLFSISLYDFGYFF